MAKSKASSSGAMASPVVVPMSGLKPDENNARHHSQRSIEVLVASLKQFGQPKPIVVQKSTSRVIAGNGLFMAAKRLGWKEILASVVDWPDEVANAFAIADNRTAEISDWDVPKLTQIIQDLKLASYDLSVLGFTDMELAQYLAPVPEGRTDPDEVPEPMDAAVTKPGDIWILGNHRLMCGDSGSPEDLDRLLRGQKIHLANTDPPYNVKVEPRSNNAIAAGNSSFSAAKKTHHQSMDLALHPEKGTPTTKKMRAKDRPLANDFVTDAAFDKLLLAWFGNIARVLVPGGAFYIWGGYANCANYPPVMKTCGLYFSQAVIWVKEHPVLTRKDFMGNHEWCFYGWKEGAAHRFFGPNNVPDVWSIKKVNPQSMVHLTEKPVELAKRAIEYSTHPNENVLDLFGGSGSTLIGCEMTERKGHLMELDVHYCDVIVKRWEKFTGKRAKRVKREA